MFIGIVLGMVPTLTLNQNQTSGGLWGSLEIWSSPEGSPGAAQRDLGKGTSPAASTYCKMGTLTWEVFNINAWRYNILVEISIRGNIGNIKY